MATATKVTATKATATQTTNNLALAKQNIANKVQSGIGVTQHTNGANIKGLAPQAQIAKPTLNMCRYISKINQHCGQGNCIKRWHLYTQGQTLLCAKLTAGQTTTDITFWATCKHQNKPYLVLSTPTATQYAAIVALWQNKQLTPTNIQNVIKTVK